MDELALKLALADVVKILKSNSIDLDEQFKIGQQVFENYCNAQYNFTLDPYDIYRLTKNLELDFTRLMQGRIALHVEEGLILPHLAMSEENGACSFLNEEGRCSIHAHRPGICRLFPLGRIYENDGFSYFLQVNECVRENRPQ